MLQDIEYNFDGLISDKELSGWVIDKTNPDRVFDVELKLLDKTLATTKSNLPIDNKISLGRYIFKLPEQIYTGRGIVIQIYCPSIDKLLATKVIFLLPSPSLSDFPFMANMDFEKLPSVKFFKEHYWNRSQSTQYLVKKLHDKIESIDSINKDKVTLLLELARLYWEHNNLDKSAAAFLEALRASPHNADLHAAYLEFLYFNTQDRLAAQWLDKLGDYLPKSSALEIIGRKITYHKYPFTYNVGNRLLRCIKQRSGVSAIVPNYNYACFLKERLSSILYQTLPPDEIIILDDASTDSSMDIIDDFASYSYIPVKIISNNNNSGNIFKQLIKGIKAANNDFIWIAEADDFCDADLLNRLVGELHDKDIMVAWCDSIPVDEYGAAKGQAYKNYYTTLEPHLNFHQDFKLDGQDILCNGLIQYNCIPNVSAVVFKKSALPTDLNHMADFSVCGDWWLWRQIAQHGKFSYCAQPMNHHRQRRWMSARGVKNGAMLQQHMELQKELYEQKPSLFDPYISLLVSRYLQKDYAAYCYEGNDDSYWLINSNRFGITYKNLCKQLQLFGVDGASSIPPQEILVYNQEIRFKYEVISRSQYFDKEYYLSMNQDVKSSGSDAVVHYINNGWREGRLPRGDMGYVAEKFCKTMKNFMNPILFLEDYPQ